MASSGVNRVLVLPPDTAAVDEAGTDDVVLDTFEEGVVGALPVAALAAPADVVVTGAGTCSADVGWPQEWPELC